MESLFAEILENLSYVGSVISLIFLFQLSNLVFGLADNLTVQKQSFDSSKIKKWTLQTLLTLVGIATLTIGVSLIPFVITFTGVQIPQEYGDIITVMMIILTSFKCVITESTKAFEHFRNIMER